MFGAMPTQDEPRFLYGDALFLARFVCAIKFSAEQVFES
jgi:hypothetical protein